MMDRLYGMGLLPYFYDRSYADPRDKASVVERNRKWNEDHERERLTKQVKKEMEVEEKAKREEELKAQIRKELEETKTDAK